MVIFCLANSVPKIAFLQFGKVKKYHLFFHYEYDGDDDTTRVMTIWQGEKISPILSL